MYSFKTKRKKYSACTKWTKHHFIFLWSTFFFYGPLNAQSDPTVKYASNFKIDGEEITVLEPSPGAPSETYRVSSAPTRVICTSTTHLHFLELLGVEDKLVGFPGTQYIYSQKIRKRVEEGAIKEIGPGGKLNVEKTLELSPDIVIAFDVGKESATLQQLSTAGIQVMVNGDYMEKTALGRAEWILFFGQIFGVQDKADSIFSSIVSNYDRLKAISENAQDRPTILTGTMYGGTWFLPGGQNWFSAFFQHAGGNYLWKDNDKTGWLELSFESVLAKANEVDLWIGTSSFTSREMLLGSDERYQNFRAFKEQQVYNYDLRSKEGIGNDFFESAYARPDLVLADLISVIQPTLLPDHQPIYIRKLP